MRRNTFGSIHNANYFALRRLSLLNGAETFIISGRHSSRVASTDGGRVLAPSVTRKVVGSGELTANEHTLDLHAVDLLAGQLRETERMRAAVETTEREAHALRGRVIELEVENSHLWWLQADKHGYRSRRRQEQHDRGDDRQERMMTDQSAELAKSKDRVQKLQNELIKVRKWDMSYICF